MLTGAQIGSPDGFGPLREGTIYYFLGNVKQPNLIALAYFDWTKPGQPLSLAFTMERDEFENGLALGRIVASKRDQDLPPWLAQLDGTHFDKRDAERQKAKRPYRDYVDSRLLHIQPAVDNLDEILSAENVQSSINAWAKRCTPRQNETRFRTWLLSYLCFGRNLWTLLPTFHRSGCWDRETHARQKQGAASLAYGKGHGYKMTREMSERCVKGYYKFVLQGKLMTHIYSDTMNKVFGCISITGRSNAKEFHHPQGKPFPSLRQFRYAVEKAIGVETVQLNRYGSTRHRRSLAPSQGRFSQDVAYLLEKVEFDAYFTEERPRGYLEGSVLPPLCVVVARDVLSGAKVGIGFSFGAERMTAYLMALFSMAVPKGYFLSLFGIELESDMWECEGLPPHYKVDRGAGSSEALIASDEDRLPIRNMTPAYAGQSKATVESSHPRKCKSEGEPHYIASNLTPVELAKREIYALIRYNHTADMSARMPMDRELASVLPTPHELWKYYAGKLRSSGIPMSIPNAVRAFLRQVPMTAKKDGVYLDDRKYSSNELRACGLLNRVARSSQGKMPIDGYILDLCLRHVWVEVERKIIQLDAQLPIRDDPELLFVSIAELREWNAARAKVGSIFREHKVAAYADSLRRFETETGKSWDSGTRKPGRAKKTPAARQEAREANQHTSKRKSAS
ncbi:hypothetical protein ACOCG7_00490 [Paraburkholderia sp. DD10]|uniref:hypothetical protein n=1 Tax=Paraburkholderia sp. DD10 TaxID=3409691 RepID=UPI003BA01CCE